MENYRDQDIFVVFGNITYGSRSFKFFSKYILYILKYTI